MPPFVTLATDKVDATDAVEDHAPNHNDANRAINTLKMLMADIRDNGADTGTSDNAGPISLTLSSLSAAFIPPGIFGTSTVTVPSNTRIDGVGSATLRSVNALNGPVLRIAAGSHDIFIDNIALAGNSANQTSGYLVEIGDGCFNIIFGPGVTFSDPKTNIFHFLGTNYRNIQIGANRWIVDALQFGVRFDALLYDADANGVTISTLNNTISNLQGKARPEMVGWRVNITAAGQPDTASTPGRRTYTGVVATVAGDGNSITVTSDDGTHPNPGVSGTRFRASIAQDATPRLSEAWSVASIIGATAVRHPGGNAWCSLPLVAKANTTYYGDGPQATIIRFGPGAEGVQVFQTKNVALKYIHIQGSGGDGGADGVTYGAMGIDVKHSQKIYLGPGLEVSYFNNCGIGLRADDPFNTGLYGTVQDFTKDVFFVGTPYVHDIFTSNGTVAGTGGIGVWLFDATERVHGSLHVQGIQRHGVFLDAGTSSQVNNGQHGPIKDCVFPSITMRDVCTAFAGIGFGFSGAYDCHVGTLLVDGCGSNTISATALSFEADQNGENVLNCSVMKASLSRVGGRPVAFSSCVGCTVEELTAKDWNLVQNATYDQPAVFEIYPGTNDGTVYPAATITTSDCYNNRIGSLRLEYGTDSTLYISNVNTVTSAGGISINTTLLTDATANWQKSNIPLGSKVTVSGAGAAGATLTSRVVDIVDATHMVIADAALTTVAGATVTVSTADPAHFAYCVSAVGGTLVPDGSGQTVSGTAHTRKARTYQNRVDTIQTTFPPKNGYLSISTTHIITATGVMTAGNATLDDASAPFDATLTPLGSPITVTGAGVGGAVLSTYIKSITSPTRVTLAVAASTNVTNVAVNITQDYLCPAEGFESNYVGLKLNRLLANAPVAMMSVEGEHYSRFEFTNIGRLLWGPGSLPSDANMYRASGGALQTDNNFKAANGIATRYQNTSTTPFVVPGSPTDADFNGATSPTPGMSVPDGTMLIEYTGTVYKLWARANGVWKSAALA